VSAAGAASDSGSLGKFSSSDGRLHYLTVFIDGGGGGSRTRVRKRYWSRDYMLIRVHAPGITLGRSRRPLRTDKKRPPLA